MVQELLLWLLLPVAAASGWIMARRSMRREQRHTSDIPPAYFKGINYFLNEQPDKAIEVFIRMLEVDSDTVETHLALGNLFRRRGEVDRAIRIHQNLIARPSLRREQRSQALLELGQDYMQAGLLDRAENLLNELVELGDHVIPALGLLKDIYEQEKEWDRAIVVVQKLENGTQNSYREIIANYYCELAEQAIQANDQPRAKSLIKQALATDFNCVRASILQGYVHQMTGDHKAAIKSLKRVEQQNAEYLSEIVEPLYESYSKLGRLAELLDYLKVALNKQQAIQPVLLFVDYLRRQEGDSRAREFLTDYLMQHPSLRGLAHLIDLQHGHSQVEGEHSLDDIKNIIDKLLENSPLYCCNHCGFSGRVLHWQCPSCRCWNCIKPVQGSMFLKT